jgi:hypothetical protein
MEGILNFGMEGMLNFGKERPLNGFPMLGLLPVFPAGLALDGTCFHLLLPRLKDGRFPAVFFGSNSLASN